MKVSILVLMEVPLQRANDGSSIYKYIVSILVLMEVPLQLKFRVFLPNHINVSILVLMEVPLQQIASLAQCRRR